MLIQAPWLRILHVNEGAQLDAQQRAALKTLASESRAQPNPNANGNLAWRKQPHKTLVTLGGNFLGPSVQSALDGGGAVQVQHWTTDLPDITHACLGLYEANHLPLSTLAKRLDQCHFCVLNTNATELAQQLSYQPTSSFDVVELYNGRVRKRIALTGLLSHDPSLHALGGACANTGPVNNLVDSGRGSVQSLRESTSGNGSKRGSSSSSSSSRGGGIDLVVPLTHASLADNRLLAHQMESSNVVPVVLCGGSPTLGTTTRQQRKTKDSPQSVDETQANGVRLVQPTVGQVAVVDIQWKAARNKVSVKVQMVPLSSLRPHAQVLERGLHYEKIFWRVLSGRLFRVERWLHNCKLTRALQIAPQEQTLKSNSSSVASAPAPAPVPLIFSTKDNAQGPSVAMSAFATLLRIGWTGSWRRNEERLAAVFLPANCVVGHSAYNPKESQFWFAWKDLQKEMPQAFLLTTALLSGRVLQQTVQHSRKSKQSKHASSYLHTCSNVQYKANDPTLIERINGQPLDLNKEYWVAFPVALLDRNPQQPSATTTPLIEWAKNKPTSVLRHAEACQSSDLVLTKAVAPTVWFQPGSFLDLRVNGIHGWLTRAQIQTLVQRQICPKNRMADPVHEEVAETVTDAIMTLVASVHEKEDDFDSDEEEHDDEDIVTPVDVMMMDCIIHDAVLSRATNDTERDVVLRDCGADFVGVDDHTKQVTEVVESFVEQLKDYFGEETGTGVDEYVNSSRVTSSIGLGQPHGPGMAEQQQQHDDADDLHAPLVKRLTRRSNLQ